MLYTLFCLWLLVEPVFYIVAVTGQPGDLLYTEFHLLRFIFEMVKPFFGAWLVKQVNMAKYDL